MTCDVERVARVTENLEELVAGLRRLVASLEGADGGIPANWKKVWEGCQEGFLRHRESGLDLALLPGGEAEEVRRLLEDVARLHAVAVALVARQSEEISAGLERVSAVRRHLEKLGSATQTGESCDVRG